MEMSSSFRRAALAGGLTPPCQRCDEQVVPHDRRALEEIEREHILAVLEGTGWRVSGDGGAARLLGMKPTTLEARMKKLGITRRRLSGPL